MAVFYTGCYKEDENKDWFDLILPDFKNIASKTRFLDYNIHFTEILYPNITKNQENSLTGRLKFQPPANVSKAKDKIAAGGETALPPEADTRNDKYFYPKDLIDSRFHGNDEFKDEILTPATAFGVRMTDGSARRCGYKFNLLRSQS